jgi:uncharacterized protein (DUF58 family)
MKLDHISKIKGNVSLTSNLKSTNVLDGAYRSIFKGKSLNFEELREYNIGDNVRDIDWRASARSMNILVREHVADKKHNILFILDSKYDMNANSNENEIKRDLCINIAGTIAYLAYKNGDYTSAIYMQDDKPKFFSYNHTLFHIENYLTYYDEDLKNQNIKRKNKVINSLNDSIDYIVKYSKKKSIVFIITDMAGFDELNEDKLKLLAYGHDIMAIQINDIDFTDKVYDIDNRKYFSPMFSHNKKLAKVSKQIKEEVFLNNASKLKKYGIPLVLVNSNEEVITKIVELLKMHSDMINK